MNNRAFWLLCATINVWTIAHGPTWYIPVAMVALFMSLLYAFEADE